MSALSYSERAATGTPRGLLILHHGRGANEHDLLGLADIFDPDGELHVVAPRAPLALPGWSGYHWYVVPRVGYPDPDTFTAACEQLGAFHDELWERTGVGPEETVLGGFSMGAVMSYALGLGEDRPRPRGILALSGFIPTVPGWTPALATSEGLNVFIGHGSRDEVIAVDFGRGARAALEAAGAVVEYDESTGGHAVGAERAARAARWIARILGLERGSAGGAD
jgi:phospholipase/carboxylesterase